MQDKSKLNYLTFFLTFFKIGLFTIGGGYVMLPLIRKEVVEKHQWMDDDTFLDGITASQSCPGAIAVNMSVYAGYHVAKWTGVALAVAGTVLPSFLVILVIAASFSNWADYPVVQKAFRGLRPCVTALIAVPILQIIRTARLKWYILWLPIAATVLIAIFNVSPISLIVLTILGSWWKLLFRKVRAGKATS